MNPTNLQRRSLLFVQGSALVLTEQLLALAVSSLLVLFVPLVVLAVRPLVLDSKTIIKYEHHHAL